MITLYQINDYTEKKLYRTLNRREFWETVRKLQGHKVTCSMFTV